MFLQTIFTSLQKMHTRLQYQKNYGKNYSSGIGQLNSIIEKSIRENRQIFKKILEKDKNFGHKFYVPISQDGVSQDFLQPLLLKQIDYLMEQKDLLLKKQEQVQFNAEKNCLKEEEESQTKNGYTALRQIWTKFNDKGVKGSQHIDNLNKIVVMVKKNINNLIQIQKNQVNPNKLLPFGPMNNVEILDSSKAVKYAERQAQKIQQLSMRNQDLQARILHLYQKIAEKDNKIQKLQRQLSLTAKQIKKSVNMFNSNIGRLKGLEEAKAQLQMKVSQLQGKQEKVKKIFEHYNGEYTIKLESKNLICNSFAKSRRTFEQILLFFSAEKMDFSSISAAKIPESSKQSSNQDDLNEQNCIIPQLNLSNCSLSTTLGLTDRYTPKMSKFIPLRTARPEFNKSFNNQNSKINNQQNGSLHGNKKFSRKCQTSSLTGKNKGHKGIGDINFEFQSAINKKLDKIVY